MKLSELVSALPCRCTCPPEGIEITAVSTHTAYIPRGALFLCIPGEHYDPAAHLEEIASAGAAAVVLEEGRKPPIDRYGIPIVYVPSCRTALPFLLNRFYGEPTEGMLLIAVTGTNGKTSTASMIVACLSAAGIRTALIGTADCREYGGRSYLPSPESPYGEKVRTMTTPDPEFLYPTLAAMRADGIGAVVMEASSHALALDKLAPLHFRVAVFTGLSPEHLDYHKTMQNYLAAKAKLFSQCDIGVVNADSVYTKPLLANARCRVLRCTCSSSRAGGDIGAARIRCDSPDGISYEYRSKYLRMNIRVGIPGRFTVTNSLLAITAAMATGVFPDICCEALERMPAVRGRMERVASGTDFSILIDYAHTPEALRNVLRTARGFLTEGGRLLVLFGCGGDRDPAKRAPMGRIAAKYADAAVITSDNSRTEDPDSIIETILSGIPSDFPHRVIPNRRDAIAFILTAARKNDIVLLVGKGHETYEIDAAGMHPFSEREIVAAALEKIKNGETVYEDQDGQTPFLF